MRSLLFSAGLSAFCLGTAQEYVVVDLGAFPGAEAGYAIDINEFGEVTGNSGGTPYIWTPAGGMVPLSMPPAATYAFPDAINNHRTVVGDSSEGPVRWLNGGAGEILQHNNPWDPRGRGINNLNQAVGKDTFAALWQPDGTLVQLGKLHASDSFATAYDINDLSEVVGVSGWQQSYAFIWRNGVMSDLGGIPNHAGAQAHSINEHGDVVGWNVLPVNGNPFRAVLYHRNGGPVVNLGVLDPKLHNQSTASDINNAMQIVGRSYTPSFFEAFFIWDPENGMRDLRPLLYPSPLWIRDPEAINDAGQIVGTGIFDYQSRPYLLNPVLKPLKFSLGRGTVTSGNTIGAFTRSEDFRMTLQPGAVFSSSQAPISFEVSGIAPPTGLSQLGVTIESSASSGAIRQSAEAYNYVTQQFDEVGSTMLTTSDREQGFAIGNPSTYVGPGNSVRIRISYFRTGPTFSYPWKVHIDKLKWTR